MTRRGELGGAFRRPICWLICVERNRTRVFAGLSCSLIRTRSWAVVLALVVCSGPLRAEIATDWNPRHTFVFAVGLLEWQHPNLWPGFPAAKKNRRDAQLAQFFRQAGVPPERVVYLEDAQATKQHIK